MAKKIVRIAFLSAGAALVAISAIVACSSDDTTPSGPDAASPDTSVTPRDSSLVDTSVADASDAADVEVCLGATDAAGLDDATVQTGLALVQMFGCAGCHQKTDAAAGIFLSGGKAFDDAAVYSANLTPDHEHGIGCWTDSEITNAILNSEDQDGSALCVMPKYSTKGMEAGAALAVATFLRTLPADTNDVPESMCPPVVDAGADADAGH